MCFRKYENPYMTFIETTNEKIIFSYSVVLFIEECSFYESYFNQMNN